MLGPELIANSPPLEHPLPPPLRLLLPLPLPLVELQSALTRLWRLLLEKGRRSKLGRDEDFP